MIRKGRSTNEKCVLKERNGTISVSGSASADFGYKITHDRSEKVDGIWANWTWKNDRFELRNDSLGFYSIFYHQDQNGFGASNSVAELIRSGCSTELDDAAIAVFLRLGFYIGNDTPFKAIRALPPGAVLNWDSTGLRLESNVPRPRTTGAPPSRSAAIAEYGDLFQAAVGKFAAGENEKIALPLSGGRDSRHILFALLKANRRPDVCVSANRISLTSNEDVAVASQVARFHGLDHVSLPPGADIFRAELEKNILTNFCSDEHSWILPLRRYLKDNAFTAIYDGIGGDVLSAGLFLDEGRLRLYEKRDLRELAENILGPEDYLPKMIRADSYEKWSRELAVERLIPELEKYRGSPNPVGQFYFWNRTRREIAASPWGILNASCHVFAPYLSSDVYAFLATLPAAYFLDHAFHTEAITHYYPESAHLPYEKKSLSRANGDPGRVVAYAWRATRYCLLPNGPRNRVNASFFLPRMLRGLVNADYAMNLDRIFNLPVYLTQLENSIGALIADK